MKKSLISCIVIVAMLLTYCVPKNADVLDNSNKEKESIAKPEKLSAETPKAQGATENSGGKDTPPTEGEGEKRPDTPPAPENEEEGKDKEAAEKELQPSTTTPDAPANKENSEQIAPPVETPAKENPLLPASGEEKKEHKQENPAPTKPKQDPTTSLRLEEEQPATSPKPKEEARKEQPTTPPAQKENTKKEETKEKQPATPSSPKEEPKQPTLPKQEKPEGKQPVTPKQEEPKQQPTPPAATQKEQPKTEQQPAPTAPKQPEQKEKETPPPSLKEEPSKPAEKPQTTPKQPKPETKPTEKPATTTTPSAPKPTEPTTTAPTPPPATTPVSVGTGTQQGVGGTSTPPTEQPTKVNPIDEKYRNKTVWVRGVNAPAYDEKSAYKLKHRLDKPGKPGWIYHHDDEYKWPDGSIINYQMLPWQPEYGYFDVKKTYTKVPGASDDAKMCWAASASNIVYWWLYHNRKYIEAYDKKYGNTDGSKKYTRPSNHFEYPMKTYPVMEEFFKKCFSNQGGQSTGGVEYFISARRRNLPSAPRYKGFKGFFSNVFTEDISFSESFYSMRKEPLNAKVKKALEEGKAINFIVAGWAKEPGPHVMTVWGFDFDEEGCISAVYFVDNNNNSNTYYKQSLKRYQVVFEAPEYNKTIQVMYIHHPVVADPSIKNPKAARRHKVSVLEFFDLRQDIWKQHFPDVEP